MTLKKLHPLAPSRLVFAIVLTLLSVYLFFSGTLFWVVLLGAALKLALQDGIEIDLDGKRYRKLYAIFEIPFGTWKPMPQIEYLSVFKTKKKSRSRVIAAEASLDFTVYKLNLFYDTNKHIEAYVADSKEDAFEKAKHIATVLDVEIHDATE